MSTNEENLDSPVVAVGATKAEGDFLRGVKMKTAAL